MKNNNKYGSGQCYLIDNAIAESTPESYFSQLKNEVNWQPMHNRGNPVPRLVAVQGAIAADGVHPFYRHPADEEPTLSVWTPTIDLLRKQAESLLSTEFNHALIQYYRSGHDWIGRHSDKTLDITKGTAICNFSFGASRVMVLRKKTLDANQRHPTEKISLTNRSLFILDEVTNRHYQHFIKKDGRASKLKRLDERDFAEQRISITFRSIATFITPDGKLYGQGARCKTRAALNQHTTPSTSNADDEAAMLAAFAAENKDADFDWDKHYGQGFDAINFKILNAQSST